MRVLYPHGPAGRHQDHWNWCDQDELVGLFGSICSNSCSCGCGRSFVGCRTAKATSRAAVQELDDLAVAPALAAFRAKLEESWPNSQSYHDYCVASLFELAKDLLDYPVGTVVQVVDRKVVPM